MAENHNSESSTPPQKSPAAVREEKVFSFWEEHGIFEKTLEKDAPHGEFVFYEGPPTANGRPGIHHLEARAFKDVIPRYKTMRGFHVRRKAGWDTHGLPVELEVEKQLGLTSKKQIEEYGIAAFNRKCKESVWKYVDEWEKFTKRVGYWLDTKNPYVTYEPSYIESLWNIIGKVNERGLLYKDYKVVPWCPRCGTALSSHELAQGYQDVKDLSVAVKFKVKEEQNTYLVAWTTTPWTLPGNVALAVGLNILYFEYKQVEGNETYILAKNRVSNFFDVDNDRLYKRVQYQGKEYSYVTEYRGSRLVEKFKHGYEPLYDFLEKFSSDSLINAYKVYAADFVGTDEGTGIVHTAVMYGQDDFELGTKVGLPKFHLVDETGHFMKGTGFLEGKFVKDIDTDVALIKDLDSRGLLFKKEKYAHSYPFCWRCKTPLIYYARDSWYIKMTALKDELIKENKGIHWEPEHIKEGRFGEWLAGVKDWAISRERYWGTPLPVWISEDGKEKLVVDSLDTLKKHTKKSGNRYFVMRHGEAQSNVRDIVTSDPVFENHLTDVGKRQVEEAARSIGEKLYLIVSSPVLRAKETAVIVADTLGLQPDRVILDERLAELMMGDFEQKGVKEFQSFFPRFLERFSKALPGGESYTDVRRRVGELLFEIDKKHSGKTILFVTHDTPAWLIQAISEMSDIRSSSSDTLRDHFSFRNAELKAISFDQFPHNEDYELDLHRPYVDEVELISEKGTALKRVKEVMDVWFDSGAMPFAQDHYPFENREWVEGKGYPADYISEAIDQTRGWFYTLHAVGVLMGRGKAFKNVVCLGHLLDKEGKKMSKSLGNVVNPWEMMEKYGVDVLRFWMYSVNQAGDSKNFDEKTIQEISGKTFGLLENVLHFYELYAAEADARPDPGQSPHVLDKWILAILSDLERRVREGLDSYNTLEPARAIRDFITDLSQWYIRRSRERFKGDDEADKKHALSTTRFVLVELAKILAPFAPFVAERIFQKLRGEDDAESVHLSDWPEKSQKSQVESGKLLTDMKQVRTVVSLGLEARAKAAVRVRQPLQKITTAIAVPNSHVSLIADELNVKEVVFDKNLSEEVALDTTITPELKEEGVVRELIRAIQDLRKNKGLLPRDTITVSVADAGNAFPLEKYAAEIKRAVRADVLNRAVGETGEPFDIDGKTAFISISRP